MAHTIRPTRCVLLVHHQVEQIVMIPCVHRTNFILRLVTPQYQACGFNLKRKKLKWKIKFICHIYDYERRNKLNFFRVTEIFYYMIEMMAKSPLFCRNAGIKISNVFVGVVQRISNTQLDQINETRRRSHRQNALINLLPPQPEVCTKQLT